MTFKAWRDELLESKFPLLTGTLLVIGVLAVVLVKQYNRSNDNGNLLLKNCNKDVEFWKQQFDKKDSFLLEQKKQTDTLYRLLIEKKTIEKINSK
jgi:Tfp pilus assembly protein PilN